ncbi:MAG: sigma-54 dependent transcriptional regulator [Planctomycetota bacterium]
MTLPPPSSTPVPKLVGVSAWAKQVEHRIGKVAPYTASVLVTGPSGTGKELIARSIHDRSTRAERPFIAVNCAAITGALFESHMFGHLKGAFTGAEFEAVGCFRAASGGTIFLDELAELDPAMQAKLLRVLQEQVVVPVGSHKEHRIDVRLVAATNRDLLAEVAAGRFREDLYYRLAVVTIPTLPLRERIEDLELLADYLLSRLAVRHGSPYKPLAPSAIEKLRRHAWPGNVRELQNVLERSCILSPGDLIDAEDVVFDVGATPTVESPAPAVESLDPIASFSTGDWPTLDECERHVLTATLRHTDFNQAAAARLLNLDRSVLRRRIKKLGISVSQSPSG